MIMNKKVGKKKDKICKSIDCIINEFNHNLSQLFKLAKKVEPKNVDLRSYYNKFKLSKWVNPELPIENNKYAFWNNREAIINRDKEYFLNIDNFIYTDSNEKDCYARNMVFGKMFLNKVNEKELREIWAYLNDMLKLVIKYKTLTKDYIIE